MAAIGFVVSPTDHAVAAESPAAIGTAIGGGIGPIADWIGDVEGKAKDAKKVLDDAADSTTGYGPLPPDPSEVGLAQMLDQVEAIIIGVLDAGQYPSLDPPEAGYVDGSIRPGEDLQDIALTCSFLAYESVLAAQAGGAEMSEIIGTKFRTILALLPLYRERAGIVDPDD